MKTVLPIAIAATAFLAGWHVPATSPPPEAPAPAAGGKEPPAVPPIPSLADVPLTLGSDPLGAVAKLAPFSQPQPRAAFARFAADNTFAAAIGSYTREFALLSTLSALLESDPIGFLKTVRRDVDRRSPIHFFIPPDLDRNSSAALWKIVRDPGAPTLDEAIALKRLLAGEPAAALPALAPEWLDDPIAAYVASRGGGPESSFDPYAWVAHAGADAWETARRAPELVGDDRMMSLLMIALLKHDPGAALEILRDPERSGIGQQSTARGIAGLGDQANEIARAVGEAAPTDALDWVLHSIPDKPVRDEALGEVIREVGAFAPAAGVAFFELDHDITPGWRNRLIDYFLNGWNRTDPAGALAWARSRSGTDRKEAVSTMLHLGKPAIVFPLLESIRESDPDLFTDAVRTHGGKLAGADLPRFSALAAGDREVLPPIAEAEARSGNYLTAAALLEEYGTDSDRALRPAWELVGRWAQDSPSAAADWMMTLPSEELRNALAHTLAERWAGFDPDALAAWMATQEPGTVPGNAYLQLANRFVADDPTAALWWIAQTPERQPVVSFLSSNVRALAANAPAETRAVIAERISDQRTRTQLLESLDAEQAWLAYLRGPPPER
ncbi:hypothetical protein BH23VER1_BH23VER1_14660 [soil metagenome]